MHKVAFWCFSTISFRCKWIGTRSLLPKGECMSCFTNYRTNQSLKLIVSPQSATKKKQSLTVVLKDCQKSALKY